jgi:17beta-estradiol 17-dehydrogenase / very-long-chain 3-oxoacyl-CoA reductase
MVMLFFIIRFVDQFSRALYVEYKSKGIDVQCQVITNLYRCMTSDFHMIASFCIQN